jgi:hypothetical protein
LASLHHTTGWVCVCVYVCELCVYACTCVKCGTLCKNEILILAISLPDVRVSVCLHAVHACMHNLSITLLEPRASCHHWRAGLARNERIVLTLKGVRVCVRACFCVCAADKTSLALFKTHELSFP